MLESTFVLLVVLILTIFASIKGKMKIISDGLNDVIHPLKPELEQENSLIETGNKYWPKNNITARLKIIKTRLYASR